jgi:hypothetical protein
LPSFRFSVLINNLNKDEICKIKRTVKNRTPIKYIIEIVSRKLNVSTLLSEDIVVNIAVGISIAVCVM